MPFFSNRGHFLRPERKKSRYEFPPFHQIKSDTSMRVIIEEVRSRSLREGDFYDEIGITPALNLAQRLASDALTFSNQTALDFQNERAPNIIPVTLYRTDPPNPKTLLCVGAKC